MVPVTGGANRKWGFTGKVETRSYERLVDAPIDFVETGDGLKERFLAGFAACLAADRKSVENRGFGVAVRKVRCHRGEDGTVRVSSVETMHERRYTVDDWKREKARYRKWAETVAFFATDCSFLDIANLVDRSVGQVVHEIHDTWYEDYMLGCIDYIASVAYHGGILLKPITTEKEITGHIGDTILSWCEKGQKDDGGNEFRD